MEYELELEDLVRDLSEAGIDINSLNLIEEVK